MSFLGIALREGNSVAVSFAATIVETALKDLAAQEAGGFGLAGNGRYRTGYAPRVTASSVLSSLVFDKTRSLRRVRKPDLTEFANEVLSSNFKLVATVRGVGNVYFYSL